MTLLILSIITLLDSIYIYLGSLRCFGINILVDFRIYYIILYKRKNIKNNKRYANWLKQQQQQQRSTGKSTKQQLKKQQLLFARNYYYYIKLIKQ